MHVLHYIPVKNCDELFTIEDMIPLYHMDFSVEIVDKIKSVRLVPEDREVEFEQKGNRVFFTIEKIEGHVMVEIAV